MNKKPLLILADDLSGANDTGVQFLSIGIPVAVIVDSDFNLKQCHDFNYQSKCESSPPLNEFLEEPLSTLVVNTDTRLVSPSVAREKICNILKWYGFSSRGIARNGMRSNYRNKQDFSFRVLKKIDSTLRGNIGTEIEEIMRVCGFNIACIAPATPEMGRTVVNGYCLVDGQLLAETEISRDPLSPVSSSSVASVLHQQCQRRSALLPLEYIRGDKDDAVQYLFDLIQNGIELIIADSCLSDDLRTVYFLFEDLRRQLSIRVLYAGSFGLFNAVMNESNKKNLRKKRLGYIYEKKRTSDLFCGLCTGYKLIVIGSMMGVTQRQAGRLQEVRGVPIHKIPTAKIIADSYSAVTETSFNVFESYRLSDTIILQSEGAVSSCNAIEEASQVGAVLSSVTFSVLERVDIRFLVVSGGDTAQHVMTKLQVKRLRLLEEIVPGIPIAEIEIAVPYKKTIYLVTKSGSFGSLDILVDIMGFLNNFSMGGGR